MTLAGERVFCDTQHAVATTADSGRIHTAGTLDLKSTQTKNTSKNIASSNRHTHTHTHRFLQRGALSVPLLAASGFTLRKLVLQRPAKLVEEQSKGPGPLQEELREACLAEIDVGIVKGPALLFDLSGVENG